MNYTIESDNDGHRFIIPTENIEDWNRFLEIETDSEEAWATPKYAIYIDGARVTFNEYKLL